MGSGNAGATNTYMLYGKNLALLVLFCDMMKTILAAILCVILFSKYDTVIVIALACLGVSVGHNFPFWLRFKGGKGVAVAVATTLVLDIRIFAVSIIVAALFAFLNKSLVYGSYTFAVMMYVCSTVFDYETIVILTVLIQSIMIWVLHLKRKAPDICSIKGKAT